MLTSVAVTGLLYNDICSYNNDCDDLNDYTVYNDKWYALLHMLLRLLWLWFFWLLDYYGYDYDYVK